MAWATAADVTARWVGDDAPSESTVTVWIGDAETLIGSEYADVDARIADVDDPLTTARVVMVVSRMVIRALRNPDNVRTQQTGPFGTTFAGDNPGGLYLSDEDRKLLGASGSAPAGVFSIDTYGTRNGHSLTCSLYFGASWCDCGADLTVDMFPIFGG